MTLNAVVLPAPFGPMRPKIEPSLDLERDVVEGDDAAESQRERSGERADPSRPAADSTDSGRASRGTPARAAPSSSRRGALTCAGSYGVWLTARTMNAPSASTSRTLMQPGDCSKPPRKMRSPVAARPRIARLTAPCRTSRATSQPASASSASSSGSTRSSSSPTVSPPRNFVSSGTMPRNAVGHHLLDDVRVDAADARRSRSRAAQRSARARSSGTTMRAVSSVRVQPARDDAVELNAAQRCRRRLAPGARPFSVSRTSRGCSPLEVAHLRVAHQVDAPARGARSLRAQRPAAGGLHAGDHPGGRDAFGEAVDELGEQRVGVPPLVATRRARPRPSRWSALIAPPQTWKTWPVMPCASSAQSATTSGDMFAGSSGSKPSPGRPCRRSSSVMRVRAFGARQLTVTP